MNLHVNLKLLSQASATACTIRVRWTISDNKCLEDVAGYKIYYKLINEENLSLLTTIDDKNTFALSIIRVKLLPDVMQFLLLISLVMKVRSQ